AFRVEDVMIRAPYLCLLVTPLLAYAQVQAQTPPAGSKKAADPTKTAESPKVHLGLEKMKLPAGGVVVVVDEIKEALSLIPKMILMTPEEYQKLLDRLALLEKQVKADKKSVHVCKLAGRLEGDFVLLRAEFAFTTEQPWTAVVLGLQGTQLTD